MFLDFCSTLLLFLLLLYMLIVCTKRKGKFLRCKQPVLAMNLILIVMCQKLWLAFIRHLIEWLWLTSPCRRVLGDGLKKLCKMERSLLNKAASFSTMYCFRRGETSSPNRAWLSCQICLFTSTAHTLYSSLSAITIFSFFSGTCRRKHVIRVRGCSSLSAQPIWRFQFNNCPYTK